MPKPYYLYCLNFPNGKKYIGLTSDPVRRMQDHREAAIKRHYLVYGAIRKHGLPMLHVLCVGDQSYIKRMEIEAIAIFQTRDRAFGYNVSFGGDLSPTLDPAVAEKRAATLRGRKLCPDHRAKIAAANVGRIHSLQTRAKMSASMTGISRSAKGRANMSAARKGKPLSPDHRAKISAVKKGRPRSRETREKMQAILFARNTSSEHRAKISAALKGRPNGWEGKTLSAEHRAKISEAHKGRVVSLETREKISIAKRRPAR
jgi:hypothetical protein